MQSHDHKLEEIKEKKSCIRFSLSDQKNENLQDSNLEYKGNNIVTSIYKPEYGNICDFKLM